jgi:hypothetical protein
MVDESLKKYWRTASLLIRGPEESANFFILRAEDILATQPLPMKARKRLRSLIEWRKHRDKPRSSSA